MIPEGMQNFAEWLVESVYDFFGTILGDHLVKRTFWFYGSVFFFILVNNYLGLIPGVGTMGWKISHESLSEYYFLPWMRGGNADLNLTAAMAFTFAALWFYWAISENGFKGFLAHIFAPKGMAGPLLIIGVPIFLFVGILEMVSIAIRPVALSFRLYGNIYGGEQTLESLMMLVPKPFAFLPGASVLFHGVVGGVGAGPCFHTSFSSFSQAHLRPRSRRRRASLRISAFDHGKTVGASFNTNQTKTCLLNYS